MTTHYMRESVCEMCGHSLKMIGILSTSTFGVPDTDGRPSEMMRSTMDYLVVRCPKCNYVEYSSHAYSLGGCFFSFPSESTKHKHKKISKEFLSSREFLNFSQKPKSHLAETFLMHARILIESKRYERAFDAYKFAAWASDDASDEYWSNESRILAINIFDAHLSDLSAVAKNEYVKVVRADLLRKTGQFEKLISEYEGIKFSNKLLNDIVAFEIKKAKEKSRATYTLKDI